MKVKENSAFSISDLLGLKLLTSLGLNFSHINEHKFMHNFRNTGTPMCYAVMDLKQRSITPPLPKFFLLRLNFVNRMFEIDVEFRNINDLTLTSLLLFGSEKQTFNVNTKILNLTIKFFKGC